MNNEDRGKRTFELDTPTAVKGCPGGAAGVERHAYTQLHAIWEEHGTEGERVRTYGSDEECWDLGMDE